MGERRHQFGLEERSEAVRLVGRAEYPLGLQARCVRGAERLCSVSSTVGACSPPLRRASVRLETTAAKISSSLCREWSKIGERLGSAWWPAPWRRRPGSELSEAGQKGLVRGIAMARYRLPDIIDDMAFAPPVVSPSGNFASNTSAFSLSAPRSACCNAPCACASISHRRPGDFANLGAQPSPLSAPSRRDSRCSASAERSALRRVDRDTHFPARLCSCPRPNFRCGRLAAEGTGDPRALARDRLPAVSVDGRLRISLS